jgi:hypothetical protein
MIEQYAIDLLGGRKLFDVDMLDDDSWLAIVGTDHADAAIFHETEVALNRRFRFPIARLVDSERFVVVDARATSTADENGLIVQFDSPWNPIRFHAGDGIADLLVTPNFIVATYFDEGVFGDTPISHDGLAVFDRNGRHQFGYQSRLTSTAVDVADCYAACTLTGDEIAFIPYTEFPLVTWNLKTGAHRTMQLPSALHGVAAITACRSDFYLFSPYNAKQTLFHFAHGNYRQIAEVDGRLKSIRHGRFIRVDPSGFSVVDCQNLV